MFPASSVSGFYLAHPQVTYFVVGQIGDDQVRQGHGAPRHGRGRDGAGAWRQTSAICRVSLAVLPSCAESAAGCAVAPLPLGGGIGPGRRGIQRSKRSSDAHRSGHAKAGADAALRRH